MVGIDFLGEKSRKTDHFNGVLWCSIHYKSLLYARCVLDENYKGKLRLTTVSLSFQTIQYAIILKQAISVLNTG